MKKYKYRFKVNVLDRENKEVWVYTNSFTIANEERKKAQHNGLCSNIYERIDKGWEVYPF